MASDEWGFIPLWKQTVRYQPESVISTDQITDFSFSCGLHLCPAARLSWAGLGASTFGSASAVVSHASETCVQALWEDPEGCKILGLVGRGKHVGPWAGREERGDVGLSPAAHTSAFVPKVGNRVKCGKWSNHWPMKWENLKFQCGHWFILCLQSTKHFRTLLKLCLSPDFFVSVQS